MGGMGCGGGPESPDLQSVFAPRLRGTETPEPKQISLSISIMCMRVPKNVLFFSSTGKKISPLSLSLCDISFLSIKRGYKERALMF